MNFIERAVKALDEAHELSRYGNPEAARSRQQAILDRESQTRTDSGLEVIDSHPDTRPESGLNRPDSDALATPPPATMTAPTDQPGRVDDSGSQSQTGPADDPLHRDDVDAYTGAVFRNSTDRVRAAHVRALRAKIDQVEASENEAPVSLPSGLLPATGEGVTDNAQAPRTRRGSEKNRDPSTRVTAPGNETVKFSVPESVARLPVNSTPAGRGAPPPSGAAVDARSAQLAPASESLSSAPPGKPTTPTPPFEPISESWRDPAAGHASDNEPHSTIGVDSAIVDLDGAVPAGGRLRLKSIRAMAYLDSNGQEDRLRETFEPMADELLEQIFADGTAQTAMGRRIMFTSVAAGAGRSLCGMHMALSLVVDHNQSVTYIDMDFAGSSIIPLLGVKAGHGVADWLDGQIQTLDALVVPTELPGLRLIGAGTAGAIGRCAQAPDRQTVNAFLLALGSRYPHDLVIIDAPPLPGGENATMLAGLSGQVIVVVEADSTPRRKLREALARLERHSKVMVMLNKVS